MKRAAELQETATFKKSKSMDKSESCEPVQWQSLMNGAVYVLHMSDKQSSSCKLAGFDFDGTLVTTKSGAKFAKNCDDWRFLSPNLPKLIARQVEQGFRFVIFSNQMGISTHNIKAESVKVRFEQVCRALGQPCTALFATCDDQFRKPRLGMLKLLEQQFNSGLKLDLQQSFYVGDAMGRKKGLQNDHSAADLLFAVNGQIPMLSPEAFLSGLQKPKLFTHSNISMFKLPKFLPKLVAEIQRFGCYLDQTNQNIEFKEFDQFFSHFTALLNGQSHVIILIGLQASGKSTFFNRYLRKLDYERISRDVLGTREKCEKLFVDLMQNCKLGKKICIDNTNVDAQSRKFWLNNGKKFNFKTIAFYFDVTTDHCLHNIKFRKCFTNQDLQVVPKMAVYKSAKLLVQPTYKEGFDHIYKIFFKPHFDDPQLINNYYMFLTEK